MNHIEGFSDLFKLSNCGGHTLTSDGCKFSATLFEADVKGQVLMDSRAITQITKLAARKPAHNHGRSLNAPAYI